MKRIFQVLVIFSLVSCTKEKESNSIVGSWRLTQIISGDSSTIFLSGTELAVEFKSDGGFDVLGPKPNYTFLRDFNKYETIGNDRIRFVDSSSQEELFANFQINKTLSLSYQIRCPYEEKFIRR